MDALPRRNTYQDLIRRRVRRILLVSSLYDSFILAEDGQLSEAFLSQFVDLNISITPDLTRVSTGAEALAELADEGIFDLVVISLHIGDMDPSELAGAVRKRHPDLPVVLLAYSNRELTDFRARSEHDAIDQVFLWQGDVRILLAMVKYVEDKLNVAHDTGEVGVPVIIVVEDNVRYYSSFLPAIYTEVVKHTQGLVKEGVNVYQKMVRQRVRPKILLATTFEEAWSYFETYSEHVLGLISDIEFPKGGELDRRAGVQLAGRVRKRRADLPIVLQSSFPESEELAESVDAAFLLKGSPVLLEQLREFMVRNFGFGEFVFRSPEGAPIERAGDLSALVAALQTVPADVIAYHGEHNHFSNWLKARGEFALAQRLRPRRVSDFATLEHLRNDLIASIQSYRNARAQLVVADFDRHRAGRLNRISRIGGGSLGGKARGLAFANRLLGESGVSERFPSLRIEVPSAVVLGTDIFDQFLDRNRLRDFAIRSSVDKEIEQRFLGADFPHEAARDLEAFLATADYPVAVRSSGLLEDSPSQPFAGVYQTYMLPNNATDPKKRLDELLAAVKRVYASTFSVGAKRFLQMTSYRLEEEKMAVIIQRIVGNRHGDRFYPDFAGVGRSHNFYPTPPLEAEDGIVAVALGLGRAVVEGDSCLRFAPSHPHHVPAFSAVDEVLKNSQREFFALNLKPQTEGEEQGGGSTKEEAELSRYGLQEAEDDGTLAAVGSTYSPDNDMVYDGISRTGIRLVNFAPVLKHGIFPLAELFQALLPIGSSGTSTPVEIEFAVRLAKNDSERHQFGFLQMRPLALTRELEEIRIGEVDETLLICRSHNVLGNGNLVGIRDLVVVDRESFDRNRSHEVATQVARINAQLQTEGVPYVLVGVGRWGSADPHLGIPVSWYQISGARAIVEAGFRDMRVEPSQGTHFFQNLTSCNIGYFTVNPEIGEGCLDWDWLAAQPVVDQSEFVRHIRLPGSITVKISGKTGEGVILKPTESGAPEKDE